MEKILFFDGTCAMCNGLVNFVLKYDRKKIYKFAPLQGHTAKKYLPEKLRNDLSTAVLLDQHGIHTQSDAIITLVSRMGGCFGLMGVAKIFPRTIRDGVYRYVAHNRHHWFGQSDRCMLLSKEEQARILD